MWIHQSTDYITRLLISGRGHYLFQSGVNYSQLDGKTMYYSVVSLSTYIYQYGYIIYNTVQVKHKLQIFIHVHVCEVIVVNNICICKRLVKNIR
jgi:hypothetical protein